MKERHHCVSPLRIGIKRLCINITFIPRRDTAFIPLQRLTGELFFFFLKVLTLCSEIIQKHKNSLNEKSACSNWFHYVGSEPRRHSGQSILLQIGRSLLRSQLGSLEFFIDIKSFRSHYGPGVDSAANRKEFEEHFLEVKAAGA